MAKGIAYGEAPQGVVQTASRLRFAGMNYEQIAARLRSQFPECAKLDPETVRKWGRWPLGGRLYGGRLCWDEIAAIVAEVRAEERAQTGTPENADRLLGVVRLIQKVEATLGVGVAGVLPFEEIELKRLKIRLDTWYAKLLAEERMLTRGDLSRIPLAALRKLIAVIVKAFVTCLVKRNMVSGKTIAGAADSIVTEIEAELPHLLKRRIVTEVIDA